MKNWLSISVIAILVIASCGKKKAPLPTLDEEIQPGWIWFATDNDSNTFEIYSNILLDSNGYISNVKRTYSHKGQQKFKKGYRNIVSSKGSWVYDTTLTKLFTSNEIDYDSLGNVVWSDSQNTDWEYITPETAGHRAATIAKMLYTDAHNLKPISYKYEVDYGNGEWVMIDKTDDFVLFDNSDILETDSSYYAWSYILCRTYTGVLDAYWESNKTEKRLCYGKSYRLEFLKEKAQYRYVEAYAIDKFGDAFYKYILPDELHEDIDGKILKKMLSHRR